MEITLGNPDEPEANGTTICANEVAQLSATGQGILNWFDAAGTYVGSGSNFSTPALTNSTTFYVKATENGCTSDSVAVEVIVESCANLSELNIKNTIGITPNPSNGIFVVSYGLSQKSKVELEIIDASGKRIYKRKFQDAAGITEHEISLKNISEGMYTLQIETDTEIHTERLIFKND
ncbi:MAG: hypothetical protein CL857_03625 [Cryomorphaceae bacterium]|nr:hypothetical protein [Cryomorphaceae bacterium]